jgi:hypothetical protein
MPERKSFPGVHAHKGARFDFLSGENGSDGFVDLVHDDRETWNPSAEQQE